MENMNGCQLLTAPKLSEGLVRSDPRPFLRRVKRTLAVPWNYYFKRWLKHAYRVYEKWFVLVKTVKDMKLAQAKFSQPVLVVHSDKVVDVQQLTDQLPQAEGVDSLQTRRLTSGDWVRVRTREEIQAMLDPFKETRGCAFLDDMYKYCGTKQRVLKSMERFLDERDYRVKKVHGVILLENVICNGTPDFGKCDRCCFLFWREEWLEKVAG